MDEKKIPINDNMPEDLKTAIHYLNDRNIGLNDVIEENDEDFTEEEDLAEDFSSELKGEILSIDDDTLKEKIDFDDCLEEENADISDLDDIF